MTTAGFEQNAERVVAVGRGVELCYQQIGSPHDPPIVLIAGLGQQLLAWPDEFVGALTARGFNVIRFDNRDAGRSTHASFPPPRPLAMLRGGNHPAQYHLGDLARDTVGLLDALGLPDAHLVGVSMGAMIAQTVTAHYPGRVRTLTSISSTTGAAGLGRPAWSTWLRMATTRPARTRTQAADNAVRTFSHIGSHGYPFDAQRVRDTAAAAFDRDPRTDGVARQLAAIFASGDRTAELGAIDVPTLVIHGDRDRMVHPSGGIATGAAIAHARLVTLPGFGHDLPAPLVPELADLITQHIAAAPMVSAPPTNQERP